jgi:Glutathione synthase/Ribosomal protein S6 modification enzyme (glutaminyl transferase)
VCRTVLNGHSGAGIVIANTPEELVSAPLYVKYIKKRDEFRVHVGSTNQIILVQRKARRRDTPDDEVNWMIRNHDNGFVFVRKDVTPPECVLNVSVRALAVTGLDFGAIDVVYHEREDRAYVLEVNTAPGLEGSTVDDYVRFFKREAMQ